MTRRDAASGFFGEENVPHQALTMGVGTILDARKIVLHGLRRAQGRRSCSKAVEGPSTDAVAASFLQQHPDATFLLDEAAAGDLTAVTPAVGGRRRCDWTPALHPPGRHLAEPDGRARPC